MKYTRIALMIMLVAAIATGGYAMAEQTVSSEPVAVVETEKEKPAGEKQESAPEEKEETAPAKAEAADEVPAGTPAEVTAETHDEEREEPGSETVAEQEEETPEAAETDPEQEEETPEAVETDPEQDEAEAEPEVTEEPGADLSNAEISIEWVSGEAVIGERITLRATVKGVDMEYRIRWESNDGSGWKKISGANGREYSFIYSKETAACAYRAVLVVDE